MEVLRAADRRAVPWKNGGGTTREVAQFPKDADWASFQWRISIATVAASGAFSAFPGISRSLAILDGVLRLDVDGTALPTQCASSSPARFDGGASTHGTVVEGPVTDLNLMVRIGSCTGSLDRIGLAAGARVDDWRIIVATAPIALFGCQLEATGALLFEPGEPWPGPLPEAGGWVARISQRI